MKLKYRGLRAKTFQVGAFDVSQKWTEDVMYVPYHILQANDSITFCHISLENGVWRSCMLPAPITLRVCER
jgi:hypothetical protein